MAAKKPVKKLKAKVKAKVAAVKRAVAAKKPKKPQAIPDNYPTMIPFVVLERCGEAIEFFKNVFGGKERMRMGMPDGRVAHAELGFGTSVLMLADVQPGHPVSNARLSLYVNDCDAVYRQAILAGAQGKAEPKDQFYGDRTCRLIDPFGNEWSIMTHFEDVTPEEMKRRMAALGG